jgi:hypothetical protein
MANLKPLDVARSVSERSPATKERGLVEPHAGGERWRLSKKGKRRLKERAEG